MVTVDASSHRIPLTETLTVFASPPVVAVTTTLVAAAGFVVVTVKVA
jgi:hypothetical protein